MTKPPSPLPNGTGADPLTREALARLVHLHSGEEKPEDWAAFEEWQASSEERRRAGAAAKRLWEQLGPALVQKSRNRSIPVLLAAAIGLSALAFASGLFGPPTSWLADHSSSVGEMRSVTLRDGSQVDLDTGTSFDVTDGGRTITLHDGQIFVSVKPDPERPLSVLAGTARIEALGTAFAVRRDGDRTTVVVTESTVRLSSTTPERTVGADITAGQAATSTGTGVGRPEPADVEALTGWRRGEIVFDARALGDVVTELNRYRRGRIFILDADIERLPVTGSFDIREPAEFLQSLQLTLPVKVFQLAGIALIRRDLTRSLPTR